MAQAERLVAQLREELSKLAEIELPNIDTKDYDKGETIRAVRQSQIAELDAVNTYDQMAQSTSDPKAKKILQDVSDEEKVHQGEFEAITDALDPENKAKVDDGKKEAEDILEEGIVGNTLYRAGQGVSNLFRGTKNAARNFSADLKGVPNKDIDALLSKLGYQNSEATTTTTAQPQKQAMDALIKALYAGIQSSAVSDVNAIRTFRTILYGPQGYVTKGIKFDYSQWSPADVKALADLAPMVGLQSPMRTA